MPKILAALEVYQGLADVESIRHLVVSKVKSMLLHSYTKVRVAAAEVYLLMVPDLKMEMKKQDWSLGRAELKPIVDSL